MPEQKPDTSPEEFDIEVKKKSRLARFLLGVWKLVKWLCISLILLLLGLWLLLRIPAVQNYIADWAAAHFSEKLNTRIEIGSIDIRFFNKILLDELYIEDQDQDTLLYSKHLGVYIDDWGLFPPRLSSSLIDLDGVLFNYKRKGGEMAFNLYFILDYFAGNKEKPKEEDEPKPGPQLKLDIQSLRLHNVRFNYDDGVVGTALSVYAKTGIVDARNMDLLGKYIEADSLILESAQVHLRTYNGQSYSKPKTVNLSDSSFQALVRAPEDTTQPRWNIISERLRLSNSSFRLQNDRIGASPERPLDFSDMRLSGLEIHIDDFRLHKSEFSGDVQRIAAKDYKGFELLSLRGKTSVSPQGIDIENLELLTPKSRIGNRLSMRFDGYASFFDFVNKVDMDITLENSKLHLKDLMAFAHPLNGIAIFDDNKEEILDISGRVQGRVNSLSSENIRIAFGESSLIEGRVALDDITYPDKASMDFSFRRLLTKDQDLKRFLPSIEWPNFFARAGLIEFRGEFRGYKNFVAKGSLRSNLGLIESAMRMDLRRGIEKASYTANLSIQEFSLRDVLDDARFTTASLSLGMQGIGLSLESLDAHIDSGYIEHIYFNGYDYKNILIDGDMDKQRFAGLLLSADPNCDFRVDGFIDISDTLPQIDILGAIHKLDFQNLKLSKQPAALSLDTFFIEARGKSIDDFVAKLNFECFKFFSEEQYYYLDSLRLEVRDSLYPDSQNPDSLVNGRHIVLSSDILSAELAGVIDAKGLPRTIKRLAKRSYPNFYANITGDTSEYRFLGDSLSANDSLFLVEKEQRFHLHLRLDSLKQLGRLLLPELYKVKNLQIHSFFDSYIDSLSMYLHFDTIQYANLYLVEDDLDAFVAGSNFELVNRISNARIGDSSYLPTIKLQFSALRDSLSVELEVNEIGKVASDISVGCMLLFRKDALDARVKSSNLNIFGKPWTISENNRVSFHKDSFHIEGLRMSNGEQRLQVNSFRKRGLRLRMDYIDLGWLYELVAIPQIELNGYFSAILSIEDLYKQEALRADIFVDSLSMNGDDWGYSRIEVEADSLLAPLKLLFKHGSPMIDTLWLSGSFIPAFSTEKEEEKNKLDLDFEAYRAKARIMDYFMKGIIEDTKGYFTASGKLKGGLHPLRKGTDAFQLQWDISGAASIDSLKTKVISLNTSYSLPYAQMSLQNDGFFIQPMPQMSLSEDLCLSAQRLGATVYDELGRPGKIMGGITHERFSNFGLNFFLCLENNLVMNTSEQDNQNFYGTVYADGNAHFHGPFQELKLDIKGKTRDNTLLVLPMGAAKDVERQELIRFVDKVAEAKADSIRNDQEELRRREGSGLDLTMRIEVTPQARAEIVLDPQTGDIIGGQGQGNLLMTYNSAGELGLIGQYEITKGDYLFTYQNLVNKTFRVQPGGTIVWSGDPYEAQLNIQAMYQQRAGLRNLIDLYITDESARRLADQRTPVDLIMGIQGQLFSPEINFDVQIPKVEPVLRSSVDLALRAVRQDKNELNRQVFGLILLQQFLPLENANARNQVNLMSSGANTLSELLGKQLSLYITDIFAQVVDDVKFIDNFQVDVDFRMQDNQNIQNENANNSELALGLDQSFANNRLRVRIGANMDLGNNNMGTIDGANQNYIGGDFIIEYRLNEDGSLKLRAYNRTESTILGRLMRSGIGISYRKEFNNWEELAQSFKSYFGKEARKLRRKARREKRAAKALGN